MAKPVSGLWLLGFLVGVCATLSSTFGLLLQKTSADLERGRPLLHRWRFGLGLIINLASEVLLTPLALSITPLAVIAPTSGLGIVAGSIISASGCLPGLKEPFSASEALATLAVVTGVLLCTLYGPRGQDSLTLDGVDRAFSSTSFLVVTACTFAYSVGWILLRKAKEFERWRPADGLLRTCILSGIGASLLAAYSIVFLKVVAQALRMVLKEDSFRVLGSRVVLGSISGLGASAPTQLYLLNMMMGNGTVVLAMPLYLAMCMMFVEICSGWIFEEFAQQQPRELQLFFLGSAIIIVGIVWLSYSQHRRKRTAEAAALAAATRPNGSLYSHSRSLSIQAAAGREAEAEAEASDSERGQNKIIKPSIELN